jgi:hypothetical protein
MRAAELTRSNRFYRAAFSGTVRVLETAPLDETLENSGAIILFLALFGESPGHFEMHNQQFYGEKAIFQTYASAEEDNWRLNGGGYSRVRTVLPANREKYREYVRLVSWNPCVPA